MYHKVKIGQLSNTQISRLLNGHGVRVSNGSNHEIELSKEQLKKYMKAHEKGKAITLTMDPFQMQNHQFLRGSGSGGSVGGAVGRRNKFNKWVDTLGARPVIEAGMSKATSSINGGKLSRRNKFNKWVDTLGARPVIEAGMSKATSSINGGKLSRRNKFNKWVDTLGAKPVIEAGMSKATTTIAGSGNLKDLAFRASMPDARKASRKYGPNLAPKDNKEYDGPINLGFGLKKRKPRKMKGSALMPAGY